MFFFFFSSRRRHTRCSRDWSSDVCSSDLIFDFSNGPPKIHEHDNKPATGWGINIDDRLVLFYVHESDVGDGWEDANVHNDPPEKRLDALKMGLNIVSYSLAY